MAVLFAKEGADVGIIYLSSKEREDVEETRKLVEAEGRSFLAVEEDVGDYRFCADAVSKVVDKFGGLDTLVNNAAEQHFAQGLEEIDFQQLERTFRTNILAILGWLKPRFLTLSQAPQ